MKSLIFFALTAASVLATGLHGGYERMLFYYIYLLDSDVHGGQPASIARGCHNCNFNDFIQYINGLPAIPDLSNTKLPNIDDTAQLLESTDFTGQFNPTLIHPKSGQDPAALYLLLSATIGGILPLVKTNDQKILLERIRFAAKRVDFTGSYEHSDALSSHLLAINPDLVVKKIDKTMPNSEVPRIYSFFDQYGTEQATAFADAAAKNAFVSGAYEFNQRSSFVRMSKMMSNITC